MDSNVAVNQGAHLCSIICLTYNHSPYSRAALHSIYEQTYRDIEIIIVDDGSSDGNQEVIRDTLAGSPFPHEFIKQENTGNVGRNFNKGILAAKGRYISFLSLDDALLPDCIDTKIGIMREAPEVKLVTNTSHVVVDGEGRTIDPYCSGPLHESDIGTAMELVDAEFASIGSFYLQGTVFSKDLIDQVGGFDEDMTGDDLILRTKVLLHMQKNPAISFVLLPYPGFRYRLHEDNLHRNTLRQVQTVLEWHWRFFPDREMSPLCLNWIRGYFDQLIRYGQSDELRHRLRENKKLRVAFLEYQRTWRYWKMQIKRALKSILLRLGIGRSRWAPEHK